MPTPSLYLPAPTVFEVPSGFKITVPVPDEEFINSAWDLIRVSRSTAPNGTWTQVADLTLVAEDTEYNTTDASGLITSWYSYTLRTSGGAESRRSEPVPALGGQVYDGLELARRAARRLDLHRIRPIQTTFPGASGTVTTTSAATLGEVIDSAYKNPLFDESLFRRNWLRFATGDNIGEQRQITRLDPSLGKFVVASVFSASVDSGDTFDIFGLYQFEDWLEWVNQARQSIWVPFDYPVAGVTHQTEYILPGFVQSKDKIQDVNRRTPSVTTDPVLQQNRWDANSNVELRDLEGGRVVVIFHGGIGANDIYYVRGRRNPPRLMDADDAWVLSEEQMEMVVVTAAVRACEHIMMQHPGVAEDRAMWGNRLNILEQKRKAMAPGHNVTFRHKRFSGTKMVSLGYSERPFWRR